MSSMFLRAFAGALAAVTMCVAAPATADVKEEVLASHAAMVEHGSFRSHSVTRDGKRVHESRADVQWPDRFHIKNDQMEVIILPGGTWMKQGGEWQAFPMNLSAMIGQLTPDAMRQGIANMRNAKELPEDTVDGKAARVFEYDTSAKIMGITADSHVTVWLDKKTSLPLKQVANGKAMGKASTTETTYEYPDDIKVTAPR